MKLNQKHVSTFPVDFDLCDAGGVVYHPNYLVLADRARARAMEDAHFPAHELWKKGQALALVEVVMKYSRPAYLGESVVIITHVKEVRGGRITVNQEMFKKEDVDLKAYRVGGFFPVDSLEIGAKAIFNTEIVLATVKMNPIKSVVPCDELLAMLK